MNAMFSSSRRRAVKILGGAVAAALFAEHGLAARAASKMAAAKTDARSPVKWIPGLQLYTLGLTPKDDIAAALKQVAAIGYREVELPGNYDMPADQLRGAIAAAGLTCPSAHAILRATPGAWDMDTGFDTFASALAALGARYAVVPIPLLPDRIYNVLMHPPKGFDLPAVSRLFESLEADDWKRTADALNAKAAALAKRGIRTAYHNHGLDFHPLPGGTNGFSILVERTDPELVDFELDIGWVVSANQKVAPWFEKLGKRLKLLHLKDTKRIAASAQDLASTDMGTGIVDWNELVGLVRHARIEHMFVEQETPFATTPMDAIKVDYRFATELFAGRNHVAPKA